MLRVGTEIVALILGEKRPVVRHKHLQTGFLAMAMISIVCLSLFVSMFINLLSAIVLGLAIYFVSRGMTLLDDSATIRNQHELLESLTPDEIQAFADAVFEFRTSEVFEFIYDNLRRNPVENERLEAFVADYLISSEDMSNYAEAMRRKSTKIFPNIDVVVHALQFFLSSASPKSIGRNSQYMSTQLNVLQEQFQRRKAYTFG